MSCPSLINALETESDLMNQCAANLLVGLMLTQRCHSLHVVRTIKELRVMINGQQEKLFSALTCLTFLETCSMNTQSANWIQAEIIWPVSVGTFLFQKYVLGDVSFFGLSCSLFSAWHPVTHSERRKVIKCGCQKHWRPKKSISASVALSSLQKHFGYQILWALLMCFWEISLFICQQWQDNENCFVHSLICCVMIHIMFDNRLRKMVQNHKITIFHTKWLKLSITGGVCRRIGIFLCCFKVRRRAFFIYLISLLCPPSSQHAGMWNYLEVLFFFGWILFCLPAIQKTICCQKVTVLVQTPQYKNSFSPFLFFNHTNVLITMTPQLLWGIVIVLSDITNLSPAFCVQA